ncbi:hypothetical protein ACFV0L_07320 [Streptosporangium canum]|uniref:hypothetical protein n=1 Tax=Streptosporangium canum TaxID=324952 RepID=UPI003690A7E5
MLPISKPRRLLPIVLMVLAAFYIVKQPAQAAQALTSVMNGVATIASALSTFVGAL